MAMRILITNDDGIGAPGLRVLRELAEDMAGPEGEIWTVAPSTEQSGTGHCVSFVRPFLISEISERVFAVEGTPADCVLAGIRDVLADRQPDLVLSGVNRGNNSGENAVYSGTVGAAMEASLQGIAAIALSQYFGPGNASLADPFSASRRHAPSVIAAILDAVRDAPGRYRPFYNVNFPPIDADGVAGVRLAVQGMRQGRKFRVTPQPSPSGRRFLWIANGPQDAKAESGSDVDANLGNFVSVTPMRADLTAHDEMERLAGSFRT